MKRLSTTGIWRKDIPGAEKNPLPFVSEDPDGDFVRFADVKKYVEEKIDPLYQRAEKSEALLREIDTQLVVNGYGGATTPEEIAATVKCIMRALDLAGMNGPVNPDENPLGAANEALRERLRKAEESAEDAELVAWGLLNSVIGYEHKQGMAQSTANGTYHWYYVDFDSPPPRGYASPDRAYFCKTAIGALPTLTPSARAVLLAARKAAG